MSPKVFKRPPRIAISEIDSGMHPLRFVMKIFAKQFSLQNFRDFFLPVSMFAEGGATLPALNLGDLLRFYF